MWGRRRVPRPDLGFPSGRATCATSRSPAACRQACACDSPQDQGSLADTRAGSGMGTHAECHPASGRARGTARQEGAMGQCRAGMPGCEQQCSLPCPQCSPFPDGACRRKARHTSRPARTRIPQQPACTAPAPLPCQPRWSRWAGGTGCWDLRAHRSPGRSVGRTSRAGSLGPPCPPACCAAGPCARTPPPQAAPGWGAGVAAGGGAPGPGAMARCPWGSGIHPRTRRAAAQTRRRHDRAR